MALCPEAHGSARGTFNDIDSGYKDKRAGAVFAMNGLMLRLHGCIGAYSTYTSTQFFEEKIISRRDAESAKGNHEPLVLFFSASSASLREHQSTCRPGQYQPNFFVLSVYRPTKREGHLGTKRKITGGIVGG
jgi:hypothetical protein